MGLFRRQRPDDYDYIVARLHEVEAEVATLREDSAHAWTRVSEECAHMREVHRIIGHIGHLPDGRVRSSDELYAHLTSLMSRLHPTDVREAQRVADAIHQAGLATLYANVQWADEGAPDA